MPSRPAILAPALEAALAAGATVVTPNNRLARRIVVDYDLAQLAAGRTVWPAATVLPWEAWLTALWDDVVVDAAAAPPRILSAAASAHLWHRIVAGDDLPLLDPAGAAALAAEAWSLVIAWGAGGESWRAWRDDGAGADVHAFARWAEAYHGTLRRHDTVDLPLLAERLAADSAALARSRGRAVLFAGFIELSPQQQRLMAALGRAGVTCAVASTLPDAPGTVRRSHPATPREEVVTALQWAAAEVAVRPSARIGIVVEDLAERRDEVLQLAHRVLAPGATLPGADASAAPFELSLGDALARHPVVAAALGLVSLLAGTLPVTEAAAVLRSPQLPPGADAAAWARRAAVELPWLEGGVRNVLLTDVLTVLAGKDADYARVLAEARRAVMVPARATPREWVDAWRDWLARCGWAQGRGLDSAEWQAREAWDGLLAQFATLAAIEPSLAAAEATTILRRMADSTVFQPRSQRAAPIAILGMLEAAGHPFDALWVAGLTADRWPPAPSPNPFLPLRWQRERGVPRCSPARELAYSEALGAWLVRGAGRVVLSCARRDDDARLVPSALLAGYAEERVEFPEADFVRAMSGGAALVASADDALPPLPVATKLRGGAYVIAQYADCPFAAAAMSRLGADPWPAPRDALSPAERGTLLHAALLHFWRALRDHRALVALDAASLDARIASAAAAACAGFDADRWSRLPPVVAAAEAHRLRRSLGAWLAHERDRPPFTVIGLERTTTLALGGLEFRMRIDRIDELAGGGLAILDYKSGRADPASRWFDAERPRSPQLGLYALALAGENREQRVRAAAFVQMVPDAVRAVGLAAEAGQWPALVPVTAAGSPPFRDWAELEHWWGVHLGALAEGLRAGGARVAPRDDNTCRRCGRQWLCRVGASLADGEEEDDDE